jgi:NAD-dependent deacetylase
VIKDLKCTNNIVFITGSGISAASNIPPFKPANQFWKCKDGNNYDLFELLTNDFFCKKRDKYWEWHQEYISFLKDKLPNESHLSIANLKSKTKKQFTIITTNFDGLHR